MDVLKSSRVKFLLLPFKAAYASDPIFLPLYPSHVVLKFEIIFYIYLLQRLEPETQVKAIVQNILMSLLLKASHGKAEEDMKSIISFCRYMYARQITIIHSSL